MMTLKKMELKVTIYIVYAFVVSPVLFLILHDPLELLAETSGRSFTDVFQFIVFLSHFVAVIMIKMTAQGIQALVKYQLEDEALSQKVMKQTDRLLGFCTLWIFVNLLLSIVWTGYFVLTFSL
jgi:hypothetical protein